MTKKKAQLSIGTPEYLLEDFLLMTAGHIQPFSVPASCDVVGIHSPVDHSPVVKAWMRSFCKSAPHQWGFENGKGNILGVEAKQSVIRCLSDLTG